MADEIQNTTAVPNTPDPLVIDDSDRYSRLRMIGWWDQNRLRASRVLVIGAGALGNEVLKNLALLGIGQVIVLDFDTIEISNLSRSVLFRESDQGQPKALVASARARELNPDCQMRGHKANVLTDVGLGLVRESDLVICCVDNREARLWINRMCWKVGRPWIDGGIQEINGVAKVFKPGDGACYECAMTENDYRLIQVRYSCPLLKREDLQQGKVPTAPTIASLIGALQVQEALKLLHNLPTSPGAALVFNGLANRFYQTRFPIREGCLSHETYGEPLRLSISNRHTCAELFAQVAQATGQQPTRCEFDRDYLSHFVCQTCQREVKMEVPASMVSHQDSICQSCGLSMRPVLIHELEIGDDRIGSRLCDLGFPPFDIVKVDCSDRRVFALLDGDRGSEWHLTACQRCSSQMASSAEPHSRSALGSANAE